jgi:hypothetical protein
LAGSAIIALGLVLAGASTIRAAGTMTNGNPMSKLVDAIAAKFNLQPSEVQAVFDEQRVAMEKEHEQAFTDRINQAVTDGKLTRDQADKIIAKKAELESLHASMDGKAPDEMRSEMKTQMDSLKKWATDNNIPAEFMMFGGHGGHRDFMMKQGARN